MTSDLTPATGGRHCPGCTCGGTEYVCPADLSATCPACWGWTLATLRGDHALFVAARLAIELSDARRGIEHELKAVALDVEAAAAAVEPWSVLARRYVQRGPAAAFCGIPRVPVRCDVCHAWLEGAA